MKKDMMKLLFKPKPRSPSDLVRHARELLIFVQTDIDSSETKREEKVIRSMNFGTFLFFLPKLIRRCWIRSVISMSSPLRG